MRIAYDDVTESFAHPRVVAAALAALPWATASTATAGGAQPAHDGLPRPSGSGRAAAGSSSGGGSSASPPVQRMPRAAAHDTELFWSRLLALGEQAAATG